MQRDYRTYFDVDLDILWDIIKNKIPELKANLSKIIDETEGDERKSD